MSWSEDVFRLHGSDQRVLPTAAEAQIAAARRIITVLEILSPRSPLRQSQQRDRWPRAFDGMFDTSTVEAFGDGPIVEAPSDGGTCAKRSQGAAYPQQHA